MVSSISNKEADLWSELKACEGALYMKNKWENIIRSNIMRIKVKKTLYHWSGLVNQCRSNEQEIKNGSVCVEEIFKGRIDSQRRGEGSV